MSPRWASSTGGILCAVILTVAIAVAIAGTVLQQVGPVRLSTKVEAKVAIGQPEPSREQLRIRRARVQGTASGGGAGGFPDASNTGIPAGRSLTTVNSDVTLSTSQVYEDRIVNGCITITGADVTIRYVQVNCHGNPAIAVGSDYGASTRTIIEYSEINCTGIADNAVGRTGVTNDDFTIRFSDVYGGCENGIFCDRDCTVSDNYVHDLFAPYDAIRDPHIDAIQFTNGASDITVDHNTAAAYLDSNAAINVGNNGGGTNNTVTNNLLYGGGYAMYCPKLTSSNMTFTGNHFSTVLKSTVGNVGPIADCPSPGTGITWSGNVYHDGANAGNSIP